ncbi:hypothetical protein FB567DRAFT_606641 [Paraphoma chrysanthemicola]|uniref:MARVEL domain-containing protein n=1 Tax=Paraphoma chrysanthemicola TaxID=798071 RepID=A0A8K0QYR9_9PLEO|nr:hypothetical protein FB567DRAFT_606641 [Paraphoma chrysanthemicola]
MHVMTAYWENVHRFQYLIHVSQALLLADTSTPRSRSTTLVLVYAINSALFLLYQYLTKNVERFGRFASLKAYMILDTLDCLLWFTAFIISCMGGSRCRGASCALPGGAATSAFLLCFTYTLTASMAIRSFRQSKHPRNMSIEHHVVSRKSSAV